jgi:hypothetical protein
MAKKSKGIAKKEAAVKEKKPSFEPEGAYHVYQGLEIISERDNLTARPSSAGSRNEMVAGKITVEHCIS